MADPNTNGYDIFHLGDFQLRSGETLSEAFLAYKTFGDASNPVIVNPTSYTAAISDLTGLISEKHASLNPSKYFIVIPALFGNGQSTSPSNYAAGRSKFPAITFADNVAAQYRLLTEKLNVKHVKAVVGFSMGGGQAYQWAAQYPDFIDGFVPICASAKTSDHNLVFLEGVKAALIGPRCGTSLGAGKGQSWPSPEEPWTELQSTAGRKAFARVYAGWGFSQTWYRQKLYTSQHIGCRDLEHFMQSFWETWALKNDPDDLLVMLQTWQLGDISAGGTTEDYKRALGNIRAKSLVAPSQTDLYFPPEDSQFEVENMADGKATLCVIPSISGHWAGAQDETTEDWRFLDDKIAKFLSEL